MTVTEAAAWLECSPKTIRNLIAAGELECYRVGLGDRAPIRITPEALEAYRRAARVEPTIPARPASVHSHFPPPARSPRGASKGARSGD